ncbi:MAG: hypothetical protein QNJ44_16055 [Rhodobacter sp.]|nr:hypothetical protein [Rhodobacter sp.]
MIARHLFSLAAGLAVILTVPAAADTCRTEIAALFSGPLDPFQRPPHRQIVQIYDADGTATRLYRNTIESPLKTIAGEPAANFFTMAIDRDLWNGPSETGPWTKNPAQMPDGREATLRRQYAEQRDNLTDTVCHGQTEDGLLHYTYRTQTTPDATGSFFGSLDQIWIDPDTGQIVKFELAEFINPWTEGVSPERHVIAVEFDPTIKVDAPD